MSIATTMTSVREPDRSILRVSQHSRSPLTLESAAHFAGVMRCRSNIISGPSLANFGPPVSMAKPFGVDGLFGAHATSLRTGFDDHRGGRMGPDEFDADENSSRQLAKVGFDQGAGGTESPLSRSDHCNASLETPSIARQTSQFAPDAANRAPAVELRKTAGGQGLIRGANAEGQTARTISVAKTDAGRPLPSAAQSDCALSLFVESDRVDVQARIAGLTPMQVAEFDRRARTELALARLGVRQIILNGQSLPQARRS